MSVPLHDSEVREGNYAWVAEPTVLVCPICLHSNHVEALHGCKDYRSVCLMVIELYCRKHRIRVATFPVGDAIDPF